MTMLNTLYMMTLQDADPTSGYHKPEIARALKRLNSYCTHASSSSYHNHLA